TPAVSSTTQMDMVHLVIGRPPPAATMIALDPGCSGVVAPVRPLLPGSSTINRSAVPAGPQVSAARTSG
ncbi:hypothetical protein, partial [Micromonospora chokoriensis]